MDLFLYACLVLALVTGLLANVAGLPGLWLMVGAHGLYAWATGFELVWWQSLVALLVLALLAEVAEFVAGAAGSKAAGGSIRSTVGAIGGGLVGAIAGQIIVPIPIVGAIVGACVGSLLGASALEATVYKLDVEDATAHWSRVRNVGWGAFKGRLWGIVLKSAFGVVMLVVSLWTAWR